MSLSTLEESTPSLNSPSDARDDLADGDKDPDEPVDWQLRCLELEESLSSFRDQANRIREILKEKVSQESYF